MTENLHQNHANCTDVTPFADGARVLWEADLCPVPCRGDNGKKPNAYKWGRWTKRPGSEFLASMILKHPGENIGILTGPFSGVTIIDVDDPGLVPAMVDRFGETPIVTRTPSDGVHLWFRWNGEGCPSHIRRFEGLPVDVKGKGGFSVEPPSVRPNDGTPYRFDKGGLEDLCRLPTIRPGSLNQKAPRNEITASTGALSDDPEIGTRDTDLFAYARLITPGHFPHDRNGQVAAVLTRNADFTFPLPERQAIQKADQAWKYAQAGTLMVPGCEPSVMARKSEVDAFADDPDAYWLLHFLQSRHGATPDKGFAIAPKAVAAILPKRWSHVRVRKVRNALVDRGGLKLIREGKRQRLPDGTWRQDPNLYKLASIHRGNDPLPNITIHPSPSPPLDSKSNIIILPVSSSLMI